MLTEQAERMRERIAALSKSLQVIEALNTEVLQMQTVDFKRYADIIINLQMGNDFYGLIKNHDEKTLDCFRDRFDKDSSSSIITSLKCLWDEALRLHCKGTAPESEEGLAFAKSWWDMVMEFTGGDMTLLPKLAELAETMNQGSGDLEEKQRVTIGFIEPALGALFANGGQNPLEEQS